VLGDVLGWSLPRRGLWRLTAPGVYPCETRECGTSAPVCYKQLYHSTQEGGYGRDGYLRASHGARV
jgi:hypothetical protein